MYNQQYAQVGMIDTKTNILFPSEELPNTTAPFVPQYPVSLSSQVPAPNQSFHQHFARCSFMNPHSSMNYSSFLHQNTSSFTGLTAPTLGQHSACSFQNPYNTSLVQPQSVGFFPQASMFSPPLSPAIFSPPHSCPLIFNNNSSSIQYPQQYPNSSFFIEKPPFQESIPVEESVAKPLFSTTNNSTNSIIHDEDSILNEAIEKAVSENDLCQTCQNPTQSSEPSASSGDSEPVRQKTLFEETLSTVTDEQLISYLSVDIIRPESVKRKMMWTATMYKVFCERVKTQMFPLSGRIVGAFLHMLAYDCRYTITSLTNVIYPSLVHLQQDAGLEADPTQSALIKAKLKSLQLDPHVKKEGKGKEPLCWFDVLELIARIPDNLRSKDMEASLFLFALQTGSRACTCAAITWGDISNYELDEETGASRIIILQRVTKGNQNWNHKVRLEGFLDTPNNGDFIYFLERHCQNSLKMSIQQVARGEMHENMKTEKVWNLSLEAMRERLKMRLVQAGFPANLFSFHSFRSGFICSSLLLAGKDPAQQGSVLDHTAFIAGWQPYGKAQKRYIKSVAEVMIVASRLVGSGIGLKRNHEMEHENTKQTEVHVISTDRKRKSSEYNNNNNSSIIIVDKATSTTNDTNHPITISSSNVQAASVGFIQTPKSIEDFHNFILKEPNFGVQGLVNSVISLFYQKMGLCENSSDDQRRLCKNAWIKSLTVIGRTKLQEDGKFKSTWAEKRAAGHRIIEQRLLVRKDSPLTIATDVYDLVKRDYNINAARPKIYYKPKLTHTEPKQRVMIVTKKGKQVRTRLRWTIEENQKLLDYYRENSTFANITEALPNRTTADAWAHFRHLKKKETENENIHKDPVEKSQNSLDAES